MIERVWRRVNLARLVTRVAIATDDDRILRTAKRFGADVFLTRPDHISGTDRVAEVAALFPEASIVVNVQGDEPFIEPDAIDQAIMPLLEQKPGRAPVSTLKTALRSAGEAADPNVVKVVTRESGDALYFSRARIPYPRDVQSRSAVACFKHLGLYVYEREFLLKFPSLRRGPLEQLEKLEQLRVLENGYAIRVVETAHDSVGVDTEHDLEQARLRAAREDEALAVQDRNAAKS